MIRRGWEVRSVTPYRCQNLRGRSFKGQNLIEADFSQSDIRGADFSHADLSGANFQFAKAGLQPQWALVLMALTTLVAVLSGFTVSLSSFWLGFQLVDFPERAITAIGFALLTLIIFMAIARWYRLTLAIGAMPAVVAAVIPIAGILLEAGSGHPTAAAAGAGMAVINIAGALIVAIAITTARVGAGAKAMLLTAIGSIVGVSSGTLKSWHEGSQTIEQGLGRPIQLPTGMAIAVIMGTSLVLLSLGFTRRAFSKDSQYAPILEIASILATLKGTQFRHANLTKANFQQAQLRNTNFHAANLMRTSWLGAKHLDWARHGGTILHNPTVRHLLTSGRGKNQSFAGLDLHGADLSGANLRSADFTRADLSDSLLVGACLESSALTKALLLGVNFERAMLTGACLEAWTIDETTHLEGIICDYVYMKSNQQDRIPASGTFAPGAFAQLFQKVLNTIELIFQNNFNDAAFQIAWNQLKVEHEETELSIQAVETKANGFVVVRVQVPGDANKAKIHADFTQLYENMFEALESRYRTQLEAKDQQIDSFARSQAEIAAALQQLPAQIANALSPLSPAASSGISSQSHNSAGGKVVTLRIDQSNHTASFSVTLQIDQELTQTSITRITGELPSVQDLYASYQQWQSIYRQNLQICTRLEIPATQVTNVSHNEFFHECYQSAQRLKQDLNQWLNADGFRNIKEELLASLSARESVRFIVQTENPQIQRLPFKLWDLFERYPQAEVALSPIAQKQLESCFTPTTKVEILAILGDSTGIDVQGDRTLLEQIPDANVTFLVEPSRQELSDKLWAQPWHILFFAGHSSSQSLDNTGRINIRPGERLSITDLKYALRKAIEQGLTLAIFNSCDGLHLASDLATLPIPYLMVMREPVPDLVAQEFLKYFLAAFSSGSLLYQAVREAREQLQALEDLFPCATWLPVIWQNSAQIPPTWQQLCNRQA